MTWVEECDFGGRRPQAPRPDGAEGVRRGVEGVPGAERAARGRRDRLPRPLRPRPRRADRRRSRRPGRPRLRPASIDELADGGRAARGRRPRGTLKPEELRGSTFTVTSAGKLAGLFQTPIVNHPEVAILSIGRVAERPVVRDGEVAVAPDRLRLGHVRPPRRRRRPRRRVRPRRHRPARRHLEEKSPAWTGLSRKGGSAPSVAAALAFPMPGRCDLPADQSGRSRACARSRRCSPSSSRG